jgi:hypothetical protein
MSTCLEQVLFATTLRMRRMSLHIPLDIDDTSLASADANVYLCQLENRIAILKADPEAPFFRAALEVVPR